jgi:hypothetical protein
MTILFTSRKKIDNGSTIYYSSFHQLKNNKAKHRGLLNKFVYDYYPISKHGTTLIISDDGTTSCCTRKQTLPLIIK